MQFVDQILIGAFRLRLGRLELAQYLLDAVDAAQDQADRLAGDRHAVAKFAHQGFAGMRQRFQARQPEEAAGAFP